RPPSRTPSSAISSRCRGERVDSRSARRVSSRDIDDMLPKGVAPMIERIDAQLEVRDLGPGLWIWRILHPGWTEDADWQPIVTCTCVDLGSERLLLDPLVPPPDASSVWGRLDARPPTAVVTLLPDHVRPSWRAP